MKWKKNETQNSEARIEKLADEVRSAAYESATALWSAFLEVGELDMVHATEKALRLMVCLRLELLLQFRDGVMLLEKGQYPARKLLQVVVELGGELLMQQLAQAGGGVLKKSGRFLRAVQMGVHMALHLLQQGAAARPGAEGEPVAVHLAVQHIVDSHPDRALRLVAVPIALVQLTDPRLRLG